MKRRLGPGPLMALALLRDAAARAGQEARHAALSALVWIDKKLERAESSLGGRRKGETR